MRCILLSDTVERKWLQEGSLDSRFRWRHAAGIGSRGDPQLRGRPML